MPRPPVLKVCIALLATVILLSLRARTPETAVTFLDVGQGDATLIQHGRVQVLVDAGPDGSVLEGLGDAMPVTDRTIEFLVITHPHIDHYGGGFLVGERYRIGMLILGEGPQPEPFSRLVAGLRAAGTQVRYVHAGDGIRVGADLTLSVLWPAERGARAEGRERSFDVNERSLVIRVAAPGGISALLTGDVSIAVEDELLEQGLLMDVDVLKVGHHGSRYSTSTGFLDATGPDVAVISVGKNRYGHPSTAVMRRLHAKGIRVLRTDTAGSIRLRDRGAGGYLIQSRGPFGWHEIE